MPGKLKLVRESARADANGKTTEGWRRTGWRSFDIDTLRSFIAIAETGSFTRAGERVGRSQSAVSMQMQRLAQLAGGAIFKKVSNKLYLTRRGQLLHSYAQRLIALNEEALHRVRAHELTGRIRLGVGDDYAESHLTDVLDDFRANYPNVALEITVNLSNRLIEQLERNELDVVVGKQPADGEDRPRRTLSTSAMVWVASARAAGQCYDSLPLIVFPERSFPREQMIAALDAAGIKWHVVSTSHSLSALRASVAAGFGVTAVADMAFRPEHKLVPYRGDLPALPDVETVIFFQREIHVEATRQLIDTIVGTKAERLGNV